MPTSSTVSGIQIRYSFSSMVLPAADRGEEGGVPTDEQGWRPAEGKGTGSRQAKQSRRCAQLLAASGPPRSMSSFESRCL